MNRPNIHRTLFAALVSLLFLYTSCQKEPEKTPETSLIKYSVLVYDSVEGASGVEHFAVNRMLEIEYDPYVDKCYMASSKQVQNKIDTFDRSPAFKRGYINRRDMLHRIIFNGDTITIHHNVNNLQGETRFRYTHGVRI